MGRAGGSTHPAERTHPAAAETAKALSAADSGKGLSSEDAAGLPVADAATGGKGGGEVEAEAVGGGTVTRTDLDEGVAQPDTP